MFTKLFHSLKERFMSEIAKPSAYERYMLRRADVEKKLTPDKAKPNPKEIRSPSGRYLLRITNYAMGKNYWDYSRGEVFDGGKLVASVARNYGHFPYGWVENHPNGHDYLLCGEDYQGYTVIELDTGSRKDLMPDPVKKKVRYTMTGQEPKVVEVDNFPNGYGFCWVAVRASPDRKVIAVSGCYWAAPYEVVLLDFSEPMRLPYWELERWDEAEDFESWETEGRILLSRTVDARKSDGKLYDEIPDAEMDALTDADFEERKITKLWEPKSLPVVRSAVARKEYERLLRDLVALPKDAEHDYEVIAELMDAPYRALTQEDRDAVGRLSAELIKVGAPS